MPKTAEKTAPKPAPAKPRPEDKKKPQKLPPWNVVLLDDDEHSYEYVIEMLGKLFAHPKEKAYLLAKEVDASGRVIVLTTHKEKAEFKRDQIHGYGADAHRRVQGFDVGDHRAGGRVASPFDRRSDGDCGQFRGGKNRHSAGWRVF